MTRIPFCRLGAALIMIMLLTADLPACTSFRLQTDAGSFYVHSLNQGNLPSVPGLAFINPRGERRQGFSWVDLTRVNESPSPSLLWNSQYGSVTFNTFGRGLPDGGMNEAGLFVWEMGFDTEYPNDSLCPTLFQTEWMQYLLDNYGTVAEVIAEINRINLDGWGWHYFLADTSGATAIVDFVEGITRIYTGEEMPIPLCCNSTYPEALTWLRQYEGFGGDLEINEFDEELPRFIFGAKLLAEYDHAQDPIQYSFQTLDDMSRNVRWSIVFDVARSQVYFRTNTNRDIRFFSFGPEDFEADRAPLTIDINSAASGDIRDSLVDYRSVRNQAMLAGLFTTVCDAMPPFREFLLNQQSTDVSTLADTITARMESAEEEVLDVTGGWHGTIKPASGVNPTTIDLHLTNTAGGLTGLLDTDGTSAPVSNLSFRGGFLTFAIAGARPEATRLFQLHLTGRGLRGKMLIMSGEHPSRVDLLRVE